MAGLINVGADYSNRALSGFIRESAEQSEIDTANNELSASRKAQKTAMGVQGSMLGGVGGYLAATSATAGATELGASLGAWAGPVGAIAGAGLGFLFSQLF
jgi:hypothetical protein